MDELKTVNCEQLMTTPLKPIEFCVDRMISTGLFILAGAPKIGKSWLALDMALSIAKGEKVLGREAKCGTALYLCLENSYTRIQNRLFDLTSEPSENLYFAIMAGSLGGVLEKQIENFKSQHLNLKIVIIDTLQKIRSGDDASYASDYKELSVLKNLADTVNVWTTLRISFLNSTQCFLCLSSCLQMTACSRPRPRPFQALYPR